MQPFFAQKLDTALKGFAQAMARLGLAVQNASQASNILMILKTGEVFAEPLAFGSPADHRGTRSGLAARAEVSDPVGFGLVVVGQDIDFEIDSLGDAGTLYGLGVIVRG